MAARELPPDPDRWVWLLDRLRLERDVGEVDVGTVVLRRVAGPQLDDRLEVFVRQATALVERDAQDLELALGVADADRDVHPTTRQQSRVDTAFANTTGSWYGSTITEESTTMRDVAPATKLIAVMACDH